MTARLSSTGNRSDGPLRRIILASAALLVLPLSAVAFGHGLHAIAQADRKFQISAVTIDAGDVLRFSNDDPYIHQIYIDSPGFKFESSEQPPQQVIEVRFPTPGVYTVMCHIHPTMRLTVTVK